MRARNSFVACSSADKSQDTLNSIEETAMRHATIATLALTAAALTTTIASAAGFVGNYAIPGSGRSVQAMNQSTPLAHILALPIKVVMASGAVEAPVFVAQNSITAVAQGNGYLIVATMQTATQTMFGLRHLALTPESIVRIHFGGAQQSLVFDRTSPNPGSAGSLAGQDVAAISVQGLWDARAVWSNPIKVGTAPVRNDAYNMLSIYFSAGVNNGDSFYFTVDTDSAQ